ncbi:MAG: energy-coupling factor transporter ATPase [Firmicutes bacterium]|nr:energy-coupling factor transporter ATPase [Bacillota bacterium]
MSIRIEQVSYTYNIGMPTEKQALKNISLDIEKGEFLGLIGHTGSGKSTLVQHLNGLIKPSSGKIYIDDVDIHSKEISLKTVRQKVGMVFQYPEHQLFGETVYEDVAFGPRNLGVSEEEVEQRVREGLAKVDLDYQQLKDRSPFELSGGQKRRVAIAGVLAMKPEILILDEPTAGLDPRGRDEILDQISRIHQAEKTTVILVTHSMEDIARLATKLVVMEQGSIVLVGTPNEVFEQADYLEQIGLGVPQVTKLLRTLQAKGCAVRPDLFTLEDAEEEIVRLLETKKNGYA